MTKEGLEIAVTLCAIICGRDGVISEDEISVMYQEFSVLNSSLTQKKIDSLIDRYFDENPRISDIAAKVTNSFHRATILRIAEKSAAADGLDERENLALEKLKSIWC